KQPFQTTPLASTIVPSAPSPQSMQAHLRQARFLLARQPPDSLLPCLQAKHCKQATGLPPHLVPHPSDVACERQVRLAFLLSQVWEWSPYQSVPQRRITAAPKKPRTKILDLLRASVATASLIQMRQLTKHVEPLVDLLATQALHS